MSPRRAQAVSATAEDPAAALREHLVDAAAELLSERQVNAITTRDIARAAHVSDGVLYNYFADKNELLVAALVRHFETVAARSHGELPTAGSGTVADNLTRFGEALYDLCRGTFPMIAALVGDPVLLRRVMEEIHRPGQGILPFLSRIGDYLTEEQRLGRIADVDLTAAIELLTGACASLTVTAHLGLHSSTPPRADDESRRQVRNVVNVLLSGIA
jgi:AcrR family transcriptional regulator